MRHIRRFSKPKPKVGIQGEFKSKASESSQLCTVSNGLPWLPPELLILIASFVGEDKDLVNLCTVSKAFAGFCTPMLYKTIASYAVQGKAAVQLRLYHTLQNPRFSNLVTELRVALHEDTVCDNGNHRGVIQLLRRRCTCDAYDRVLGEAILALRSLKSLTINCDLPRNGHDHGYLCHPQVPMLQRFAFRCFESGRFTDSSPFKSILFAPFMSSVTTLALECHASLMCSSRSIAHHTLIERPEFAPHLHTLQHGGGSLIPRCMLAIRPIERLCFDTLTHRTHGAYAPVHEAIWKSPGTLSHLFSVDLLQWLPRALAETVQPYRNLKFIGTITGSHCEEDAALHEMDILAPLDRLEAMEVNQYRAEDGFQIPLMLNPGVIFDPPRRFFDLLQDRHPLLRRVLLIARHEIDLGPGLGPKPVLWENFGGWSPRPAPYLEYWDILCDRLGS